MTKVPFLDLRVQDPAEREELLAAVAHMLDHGRIVLGPEVAELESQVAERVGRRYAVGVNSGTDALIIGLHALGIGASDEVIVPPLSFIATANAVALLGGVPVFGDLADDLNFDPASIEALITPRTKAILPVHWTGRVCAMDAIMDIAARHGLQVIEDCSQAFDGEFQGRKAGSFGAIGCFSMNSMKVFASLGEAGMLVTDDPALYERCVELRYHGLVNREYCTTVSHNGRLDTLQAAALLVRLPRVAPLIERRRQIAAYYNSRLGNHVKVPVEAPDERHVYYTYTIQSDRRDALKAHLEADEIEVKIQHPLLMPQHPVYGGQARGKWSHAEQIIGGVLCLPANEKITDEQAERVADSVIAFFQR